MPLEKYDIQKAAKMWSKISDYQSVHYHAWHEECKNNREFYEGMQYTNEEREILQERGQYDLVVNKIRKAIKGIAGLVTASIPKYNLIPVGKHDAVKASLGNQLLDWVWDNSNGLYTYRSAVKSALVDNMAYLHVICPADKRIKFVKLGFDDVVVDPNSKHPLFDDAEMIIIRKYVSVDYVKRVFGIDNVVSEIPNEFYSYDPRLTTDISKVNFLSKVFDINRNYVNLYECYRKEVDPQSESFKTKIIKETVIGYMHAFKEELPPEITDYPVIPIYVEGYDNPYKRGEVFFLKEIQRFINKTYGVTILNAQLMSNPKIFIRDRDIPKGNIEEFQNNYNIPGSVNVLTGDANPPMVINGQPLNNAFYSLYLDAKQEFEWLTVPNQILGFGNDKANQSEYSLLDVKENTLESLKDFISVIELVCSRLGLVCLQYVQAFADENMIVSIPDSLGRRQAVELNKKQGLDIDNEQSIQQFIQYMKQQGKEDEEIQSILAEAKEDAEYVKDLDYVLNETNFAEFDVRVIPGSYSPTYQMAMLRLMMELTQIGAVDPSIVLDYAPVENREELKERFDTISNLRSEVYSLQQDNEHLNSMLRTAKKEVLDSELEAEANKSRLKLNKFEMEAKVKHMRSKFQDQLMTKEKMIELERLINEMVLEAKHQIFMEKIKNNKEVSETTGVMSVAEMIHQTIEGEL